MKITRTFLAIPSAMVVSLIAGAAQPTPKIDPVDAAKERLLKICAGKKYAFTPKVRAAYFDFARAQALAQLKARGKALPESFLQWVDRHPDMAAGVYAPASGSSHVVGSVCEW